MSTEKQSLSSLSDEEFKSYSANVHELLERVTQIDPSGCSPEQRQEYEQIKQQAIDLAGTFAVEHIRRAIAELERLVGQCFSDDRAGSV